MNTDEQKRALKEQRQQRYEADYDPDYNPGAMPPSEVRIANALDYIAYQLGQINRRLTSLTEAMASKT